MNQETDTPRTDAVMQTVSQFTGDVGITDLAKMHEHAEALERELNIARSLLMYAVFGVLKICGNSYVNACTEQWLEHAASLGAYPSDGPFIGKLDEVEARFEEWLETVGGLPDWPATPRQAARYAKINPTTDTKQS